MNVIRPLMIFLFTGLFQIAGGYLVWVWLKNDKPVLYGIIGMALLAAFGGIATMQPAPFGRTYVAYGGAFVLLALLWAWFIDGVTPDRYDLLGALIAIVGVCVILFAPRKIAM